MIKVVKERNNNDFYIGVHDGMFHSDELVSVCILSILYKNISVIRSRNIELLNNNKCMLIDVGLGKYDHHQKGGNGQRDNGIKYASCGLIWKDYGFKCIKKLNNKLNDNDIKIIQKQIDEEIIQNIDATDNGQFNIITKYDYIEYFLPKWNKKVDYDSKFEECTNITSIIFKNMLETYISSYLSKKEILKLINNKEYHKDNILLIPYKNIDYLDTVLEYNNKNKNPIDFIVFSYNENGYALKCIPYSKEDIFSKRIPLPKKWAGQNNKLPEISGIKSAIFCHNERFFAKTLELDDAIKMCYIATKEYNKEELCK